MVDSKSKLVVYKLNLTSVPNINIIRLKLYVQFKLVNLFFINKVSFFGLLFFGRLYLLFDNQFVFVFLLHICF